MSEQITSSKKITVGLILSWIFGVLFALTGVVFVFSEPIPGLVMLIMAAVLLPPVMKLTDQKWKFHLSGGMKIVVIVIGLIIFSATVDTSDISDTQQSESQIEAKEQVVKTEKTETTPTLQKQEEQTEVKNELINEEKKITDESVNKQTEESIELKEGSNLTHDKLLEISNKNADTVIGKSYQMTLYLEQHQTSTQAEFMTQSDDNSMDTILISCNLKSNDLNKLDGESAQKRIYKPYNLQLTFVEYDENVGLYYKADCVLK